MGRLRNILRLPLAQKAMLLEAFVLLTAARTVVLVFPFRWVARVLGKQSAQTAIKRDPLKSELIRRVGDVVRKISRNVPWTSKCLDQAIAAKIMLARRGISTTVYFGVRNDEKGELVAHAWLRSGVLYVTGGANRKLYAVINTFADERG